MKHLRGIAAATAVLLAAGAAWLAARGPSPKEDPPHVVLLIIDTLRADMMGCYGADPSPSPELDELAQQGVRFERVVAQSSWTRPSIGSMLTSLYPRNLGIYKEQGHALNDRFTTLAEVLQAHGYRTLGATANPNINSSFNFHQGFDHHIDSNVVFRWMGKEPGQKFATERPLHFAHEMFRALHEHLDEATDEERQRPHYLQVNLMEVHECRRHREVVRDEFAELFPDDPPLLRHYKQTVRQVSKDIHQFVQDLTKRPGFERTLFVVVSDHGEGLLDHPDVTASEGHGKLLYESQLVVPWIMFSSDRSLLPPGRTVSRPVRILDMMPTLLDLLDVPGPETMQGTSLLPLVKGGEVADLPDRFFVETEFRGAHKAGVYGPTWNYFDNRDGWQGVPAAELQRARSVENGVRTDEREAHPREAAALQRALAKWEARHPKVSPTLPGSDLSEEEIEQLRALGYVQ
jgi:arylsulfatase A-like enzyme